MPTVPVVVETLHKAIGREFTEKEFDQLCFDFGVELDEVTTVGEMGASRAEAKNSEDDDKVVYKIDVPANRTDLLCVEGLAIGLRVFLGMADTPRPVHEPAVPALTLTVKKETAQIRPFVVAAVLRGVSFDKNSWNSFLDLQDKLHFNIGRRRNIVSIGTHDLDTIEGPFTYEALPPQDINFVPLKPEGKGSFDGKGLLDYYRDEKNVDGKPLREYTDLIYDSPVYPVIKDKNGVVCSLPPIINGDHSKMSAATKNVFMEVTAKDEKKANIVLNTMILMFGQYCAKPYTVEPVKVIYEADGRELVCPDMSMRNFTCKVPYIKSITGITDEALPAEKLVALLAKMQLQATYDAAADVIEVSVPPTRADVLHPCDVAEDVAIAFGYNNIAAELPPTNTVGQAQPINMLTDLLRQEVAMAGYMEVLTLGLCSRAENFSQLRLEDDGSAVALSNPKTLEFQVVRTSLLQGILKTVKENKHMAFSEGVKLMEISDVVTKDAANAVGATNRRHLCALYMGPTAGFEVVHGLVDRVMQCLGIAPTGAYAAEDPKRQSMTADESLRLGMGLEYSIVESECPTYFCKAGMSAKVMIRDLAKPEQPAYECGSFGALHPDVLKAFDLDFPGAAVELDIQHFV